MGMERSSLLQGHLKWQIPKYMFLVNSSQGFSLRPKCLAQSVQGFMLTNFLVGIAFVSWSIFWPGTSIYFWPWIRWVNLKVCSTVCECMCPPQVSFLEVDSLIILECSFIIHFWHYKNYLFIWLYTFLLLCL